MIWKTWMRSLLASAAVTALFLVLSGFLLFQFRLGSETLTLICRAIYALSSFAGAFLLGKGLRTRRFLWGLAFGGVYLAFTLLLSWTLYGQLPAALAWNAALSLGGGMLGGMVS